MARPRLWKGPVGPEETWYVYNWLMMDWDSFSKMTDNGKLFVKDKPISYNAGARCLMSDGVWRCDHIYRKNFTTIEEIFAFAATLPKLVTIVDCRRPTP